MSLRPSVVGFVFCAAELPCMSSLLPVYSWTVFATLFAKLKVVYNSSSFDALRPEIEIDAIIAVDRSNSTAAAVDGGGGGGGSGSAAGTAGLRKRGADAIGSPLPVSMEGGSVAPPPRRRRVAAAIPNPK